MLAAPLPILRLRFLWLPVAGLLYLTVPAGLSAKPAPATKADAKNESATTIHVPLPEKNAEWNGQNLKPAAKINRSTRDATDLLRLVPGIQVSQHTGGAKAHQIFLRGYDAEHGQDVAAYLDGIPLNETSHIHGHGYLDLHFLMPPTIDTMNVYKGPFLARHGNFATGGVLEFETIGAPEYNYRLDARLGSNPAAEAAAGLRHSNSPGGLNLIFWGSGEYDTGYTEPGREQAGRAFLKLSGKQPGWNWSWLYAGYAADSEASDILPREGLPALGIDRFGSIDDSNGVSAQRHINGFRLRARDGQNQYRALAYHQFKNTDIYSNYTYYFFHPERGDQTRQRDQRHFGGLELEFSRGSLIANQPVLTRTGLQTRLDALDQGHDATQNRNLRDRESELKATETLLALYADQEWSLPAGWKLYGGLRFDQFFWRGEGAQDRQYRDLTTNTFTEAENDPIRLESQAATLSPKGGLAWHYLKKKKVFFQYGNGFISPEARRLTESVAGLGESGNQPIVDSHSTETGWEGRFKNFSARTSVWLTTKDREYVFDPMSGTALPRGASRRMGWDGQIAWQFLPDWRAELELSYVKPEFTDSGLPIPNQSNWVSVSSLQWRALTNFWIIANGNYRGPRQHDLGLESKAVFIADLMLRYHRESWRLLLLVENIAGTEWNDSVFAYESRPRRGADKPVYKGLHITPGKPRVFWLAMEKEF